MDTSDLQSQDSTSFEVQSTRGASEVCVEALPSLATELLEGLPPVAPVATPAISSCTSDKGGSELTMQESVPKKLKSPDVKLNSVKSSVG